METKEQSRYLDEWMWEMDQRAVLKYAREKGTAEGHAEGLAEGEAKGEAKGRAEGRAEGLAETAKAMKSEGIPVEVISRCTGLTAEQIEAL